MNELHQVPENISDVIIMMREYVCRELCPGGRKCGDHDCLKMFFMIAKKIDTKMSQVYGGKKCGK